MAEHHWNKLKKRLNNIIDPKLNIKFNNSPVRKKTNKSEITIRFFQVLLEDERVSFTKRSFTPSDVEGCALVFAATSSRQTNDAVARACAERGILCNCADAPKDSSFIVPALVEQGNIAIALSTGGASPALARKIREDLEAWLGERYTGISELLMRLRPLVLALHHETRQNTTLFRSIVDSPLSEALQRRDRQTCESLLRELLPIELHPHIMELLHDLA